VECGCAVGDEVTGVIDSGCVCIGVGWALLCPERFPKLILGSAPEGLVRYSVESVATVGAGWNLC